MTHFDVYPWLGLLTFALCAQFGAASVTPTQLPPELQHCYNSYANVSLRDIVGQSACWSCESPNIARLLPNSSKTHQVPLVNEEVLERMNLLLQKTRIKRQTSRCRRKEYRMLTDAERTRFHDAINTLKSGGLSNRYDSLASYHTGAMEMRAAHRGPNFLGWHRVFLLIMEQELQSVDSSICLPYWDSSLDSELATPRNSYVFSPAFLGGRGTNGPLRDGPFAGWMVPRNGPLRRNIGITGQLITDTNVRNVLSQTRTRDIVVPTAMPQNTLEFHHDQVHVFIGGQMSIIATSAFDPAFFLHHGYIDYIWERFRIRQRALGINPETDYPANPPPFHEADRLMVFPLRTTAREGYLDFLTATYEYEPSPTCNSTQPSCGSRYLQCNLQRNRCIPIDPTPTSNTVSDLPPRPIQNYFCVDGICDSREWVFVPVKVVSIRPPDFGSYDSYPVYNGHINKYQDVYEPLAYHDISQFFSLEKPKGYDKCEDGDGIGQVYIQSKGLNYEGFYKELVVIDQRIPTSLAIGYLAVKNPKTGPVKALFRAFDTCGRICRTECKFPGTNFYQPCSGAFDIANIPGQPNQFSWTYGQATAKTWTYRGHHKSPIFHDNDIVLTFYCDYGLTFPWISYNTPRNVSSVSKGMRNKVMNHIRGWWRNFGIKR